MDDRFSIEKLTEENYSTWKFQMKHLLKAKGIFDNVELKNQPDENAAAEAKAKYQSDSEKAFSFIVLGVSAKLLYLITQCETASDAWKKLRGHFERDTLANKLFLKKKFFRLSMAQGCSISEHMKIMKELTDKLTALGSPVSEEDQIVTLLGSLPASYDTVVTALESRVDDLTLEFAHQTLLNEELKKGEKEGATGITPSDTALYGNARNANSYSRSRKTSSKKSFHCYGCGEENHYRKHCPHEVKKPHDARVVKEEEIAVTLLTRYGCNPKSDTNWLIDSGASRHMTPDESQFINYKPLENVEMVGLGDGHSVEAKGVGDVVLMVLLNGKTRKVLLHEVLHVPQLASNLFSVTAATKKGYVIQFGHTKCWIRDGEKNIQATGTLEGKLYTLDTSRTHTAHRDDEFANISIDTWHQRLGHINENSLRTLAADEVATGVKLQTSAMKFCDGCVKGKLSRKPLSQKSLTASRSIKHKWKMSVDVKSKPLEPIEVGSICLANLKIT